MSPLQNKSDYLTDKYLRLHYNIESRIRAIETQLSINESIHRNRKAHQHLSTNTAKLEIKDLQKLLKSYSSCLINTVNINLQQTREAQYHKTRKEFQLYKTSTEHIHRLFEYHTQKRNQNNMSKDDQIFLRNIEESTRKAGKTQAVRRIQYQLTEAVNKGWFVVFNTLTLNTQAYHYADRQKIWSQYHKKLTRDIQSYPGEKVHHYVCTAEYGDETSRYHLHAIHILKRLPDGCKDPNTNKLHPNSREITGLHKYWQHGFSKPIAVRFNPQDAYGLAGWRWPIIASESGQVPLPGSQPLALALYVGKYIQKQFYIPEGEIKWRLKTSRKMGTMILENIAKQLPTEALVQFSIYPLPTTTTILDQRIPMTLFQRQMKKEYLERNMKSPNEINILRAFMATPIQDSIVKRNRDSTRTKRKTSSQNILYTSTKNSKNTGISKKHLQTLQALIKEQEQNILGFNPNNTAHNISGNINRP